MKTVSAILYAVAMTALLCMPYVSWGQDKRDGVAVDGGTVVDGRRLDGMVFGFPTYLVEEDFEETGLPSSGAWSATTGTVNWDSTSHINMNGQAALDSSFGAVYQATLPSSQTTLWVAFKFEPRPGSTPGSAQSCVGIRASGGTGLSVFRVSVTNAGDVALYAGGADGTASSTFRISTNTLHYVWLKFVSSGTCELYISKSGPTRPSLATDTSSAFATSKADTTGSSATYVNVRDWSLTNSYYIDEFFASTTELTNPWGD